jgi:dTDP-glucose 4,6-dehydratase
VVGPDQVSNLELAEMIASITGRSLWYQLVEGDRPGHDLHYGLDPAKLTGLGWKPPIPFAESLARTVRWSLQNPEWLL